MCKVMWWLRRQSRQLGIDLGSKLGNMTEHWKLCMRCIFQRWSNRVCNWAMQQILILCTGWFCRRRPQLWPRKLWPMPRIGNRSIVTLRRSWKAGGNVNNNRLYTLHPLLGWTRKLSVRLRILRGELLGWKHSGTLRVLLWSSNHVCANRI